MTQMIFKPLGMSNTFVLDNEKDRKKIVPSYKGNGVEIGFDYLDCVYGDKNIYSTPRDFFDNKSQHGIISIAVTKTCSRF